VYAFQQVFCKWLLMYSHTLLESVGIRLGPIVLPLFNSRMALLILPPAVNGPMSICRSVCAAGMTGVITGSG